MFNHLCMYIHILCMHVVYVQVVGQASIRTEITTTQDFHRYHLRSGDKLHEGEFPTTSHCSV